MLRSEAMLVRLPDRSAAICKRELHRVPRFIPTVVVRDYLPASRSRELSSRRRKRPTRAITDTPSVRAKFLVAAYRPRPVRRSCFARSDDKSIWRKGRVLDFTIDPRFRHVPDVRLLLASISFAMISSIACAQDQETKLVDRL